METKQLSQLNPNPDNPRTMDRQQATALQASLDEFGDLSGIVYNVRLDRLVGGHMRVAAFNKMGGKANVVITQRFPKPNKQGTVAVGYLTYNGEFYAYREVDWPEAAHDLAANVAANRISGDWVQEALADVNEQIKQAANGDMLLAMTGQTEEELKKLEQLGSAPEEEKPQESGESMHFKLTEEQAELVDEALNYILAKEQLDNTENSDIRANAMVFIMRDFLDRLHGLKD